MLPAEESRYLARFSSGLQFSFSKSRVEACLSAWPFIYSGKFSLLRCLLLTLLSHHWESHSFELVNTQCSTTENLPDSGRFLQGVFLTGTPCRILYLILLLCSLFWSHDTLRHRSCFLHLSIAFTEQVILDFRTSVSGQEVVNTKANIPSKGELSTLQTRKVISF